MASQCDEHIHGRTNDVTALHVYALFQSNYIAYMYNNVINLFSAVKIVATLSHTETIL